MNAWLKLGVPLLLGGCAAAINWQVLQSELTPYSFVKVTKHMKPGDLFKENQLAELVIRSKDGADSLQATAVPWKQRSRLYDMPCVRELEKNDIVLGRDAPSRFKVIQGLEKGERALQLNLDEVKYEPALLLVGGQISFVAEREGPLVDPLPGSPGGKTLAPNGPIVLGPFRILSIGRRVTPDAEGDADAAAARVISVGVKVEVQSNGAEVLEEKASRLLRAMSGGPKGIRIMLYPYKE
jgi:hypothetical protein